jgi:hypothetical protein
MPTTTKLLQTLESNSDRCSYLSHTFSEVAYKLIKDPIIENIRAVVKEFAELNDSARQFAELLKANSDSSSTIGPSSELLEAAEQVMELMDLLLKDFEGSVEDFAIRRRDRQFHRLFKYNLAVELSWRFDSIKGPLKLMVTTLRIAKEAEEAERLKKTAKKNSNHSKDVTNLVRECELAESWIECTRHHIIALWDAETRQQLLLGKDRKNDVLLLANWQDGPGKTASWLYNMIFKRAMESQGGKRELAQGLVYTIEPDEDAPASSSKGGKEGISAEIRRDLARVLKETPRIKERTFERELEVTPGMKELALDELVMTWVCYDAKSLRRLTDGKRSRNRKRIQDLAKKIGWYTSKGMSSEDDLDETNDQGQAQDTPPWVPSAPPSPRARSTHKPNGRNVREVDSDQSSDGPIKVEKTQECITISIAPGQDKFSSSKKLRVAKESAPRAGYSKSSESQRPQYQQQKVDFDFENGGPRQKENRSDDWDDPPIDSRRSVGGRDRSIQEQRRASLSASARDSSSSLRRSQSRPPSYLSDPRFHDIRNTGPMRPAQFASPPYQLPPPHPGLHTGYDPRTMMPMPANGFPPNHQLQNDEASELRQRLEELEKKQKAEKAREDARKLQAEVREEVRKKAEEQVEEVRKKAEKQAEEQRREMEELQKTIRDLTSRLDGRIVLHQAEVPDAPNSSYRNEDKLWEHISQLREDIKRKEEQWAEEKKGLLEERMNIIDEAEKQFQKATEERNEIIDEADEQLRKATELAKNEMKQEIERLKAEHDEEIQDMETDNKAEKEKLSKSLQDQYDEKLKAQHEQILAANKRTEYYVHELNKLKKADKEKTGEADEQFGTNYQEWREKEGEDDEDNDSSVRNPFSTRNSTEKKSTYPIIFHRQPAWANFDPDPFFRRLATSGFNVLIEQGRPAYAPSHFERVGTAGNKLRATLFWQPPTSTADADLYNSLRSNGWRPAYVRMTDYGQTWFLGANPVHVQFFTKLYVPQISPADFSRTKFGRMNESLIISTDVVEVEELKSLGHHFEVRDGKIYLDPALTSEDIDHIVARSFLAREGRDRKEYRLYNHELSSRTANVTELESEAGDLRDVRSESSSESNKERRVSFWQTWTIW